MQILIAGGGPAGAAAAIAARLEGLPVRVIERAGAARHKVCGEFISPGAMELLEDLQVRGGFEELRPRPIERCVLYFGNRSKQWKFSEPAWGLSRLRLDSLLLEKAAALGAAVARGHIFEKRRAEASSAPMVIACGRSTPASRGDRLFGFKAHFEGPSNDAVEIFFDARGYAGVSGIENGLTNVCGIAPESALRKDSFDFDEFVLGCAPLAERLKPLRRRMNWLVTGPLAFSPASAWDSQSRIYPAGDSLGFIDPFTGSGILNALLTGRLAGLAAARGFSSWAYLEACRAALERAYRISGILRRLIFLVEPHWLARFLPGHALFRMTRPAGGRRLELRAGGRSFR